MLVTSDNATNIFYLVFQLNTILELKYLGEIHYFLGLEASYPSIDVIQLSQAKYIRDLLKKAGMASANVIPHFIIRN